MPQMLTCCCCACTGRPKKKVLHSGWGALKRLRPQEAFCSKSNSLPNDIAIGAILVPRPYHDKAVRAVAPCCGLKMFEDDSQYLLEIPEYRYSTILLHIHPIKGVSVYFTDFASLMLADGLPRGSSTGAANSH